MKCYTEDEVHLRLQIFDETAAYLELTALDKDVPAAEKDARRWLARNVKGAKQAWMQVIEEEDMIERENV